MEKAKFIRKESLTATLLAIPLKTPVTIPLRKYSETALRMAISRLNKKYERKYTLSTKGLVCECLITRYK